MLVSQEQAAQMLTNKITEIELDKDKRARFVELANEKFNMATGDASDYLSKRKNPADAGLFDLFIIAWVFDKMDKKKVGDGLCSQIFTEPERKEFSKAKFEQDRIEFPIDIKCIPVDDKQWIGASDVNFLMKLRDAQLINYNVNAQRTMKRYIRGGNETWQIQLNRHAVNEIKNSLLSGDYIPNTITLNIPEDEFDFAYDSKNSELVINKVKHFDIADGYHRYMAMAAIHDEDSSFNYPIELRIIHFTDEKIKQFIFQEDQKTKMRKIDSDSMNMSSPENLVTERVNEDPGFIFSSGISRNGGIINYGEFARCVRQFYFVGHTYTKSEKVARIVEVKKEIVSQWNNAFADETKFREHYGFKELMLIFTAINKYGMESKDVIQKALEKEAALDDNYFINKIPRRGLITQTEKFLEEVK